MVLIKFEKQTNPSIAQSMSIEKSHLLLILHIRAGRTEHFIVLNNNALEEEIIIWHISATFLPLLATEPCLGSRMAHAASQGKGPKRTQ